MTTTLDAFRLDGRVAIITGGAGLLGRQHAESVADAGGTPVIWDIAEERAREAAEVIVKTHPKCGAIGMVVDVTSLKDVTRAAEDVIRRFGRIHILVNNAANDPKMGGDDSVQLSRVEHFPEEVWAADIAVGLTGAFHCSRVVGAHMAAQSGGVILNIASDLALISPDQRIYRREGLPPERQPVKPVTYPVVKAGLVGLTRYLATYWADRGVRVNAISPGGMYTNQDAEFVAKLTRLIPLGRMATTGEYRAAVLFLVSDASSYMTGANLVIDGGRTTW